MILWSCFFAEFEAHETNRYTNHMIHSRDTRQTHMTHYVTTWSIKYEGLFTHMTHSHDTGDTTWHTHVTHVRLTPRDPRTPLVTSWVSKLLYNNHWSARHSHMSMLPRDLQQHPTWLYEPLQSRIYPQLMVVTWLSRDYRTITPPPSPPSEGWNSSKSAYTQQRKQGYLINK